MRNDRSRPERKFPNLFYLFIFFGLILGGYVSAREAPPGFEKYLRTLDLVLQKSAHELEIEKHIFNSIDGMLDTLDPHTHFLDPTVFRLMSADQQGKFSGIGIAFDIRNGNLTVVSPIENTPAYEAGLRTGDIIIEIEGVSTVGIKQDEVINKLRGEKGSSVTVTIQRPGGDEPFKRTLIRDDIPLDSVKYPMMLTDEIGYVRLIRFAQDTAKELDKHLQDLESRGMKKLIIDLRTNGGGLLSSAHDVSSKFLEPEQLVVYTRGKGKQTDRDYKVEKNNRTREYPLIILVGESTASGAEILAGAVQDWDRGLILGSTTFGKGLVQRLFVQSTIQGMDSALQVTTSQYFTPSGRNIQKPYDTPHRKYFRKLDPATEGSGDLPTDQTYTTAMRKRTVFGGGSITPDHELKPDYPELVFKMFLRYFFFDFAIDYISKHPDTPKNFTVSADIIKLYKEFLNQNEFEYDETEFQDNIKFISNHLRAEIIGSKYGQDERFRVRLDQDSVVWDAINYFPEAEELIKNRE